MKKNNEGFSLVEVLLAMVLLAAIVIPTCTSLVLSFRVNAKAEALTQAQLAVSSAVETLMAEGITGINTEDYGKTDDVDLFPDVVIKTTKDVDDDPYFRVVVMDNNGLVSITTYIHAGTGGSQ